MRDPPPRLDAPNGGFSGVTQHSQVYTAAQQVADFPAGLPNPLTVQVCQLSSLVGRGRMKKEALYVR